MKKKQKGPLSRIFSLAMENKAIYVMGVVCSALAIIAVLVPFFAVYIIAKEFLLGVFEGHAVDYDLVTQWILIVVAAIIAGLLFELIGGYLTHRVAYKVLFGIRIRLMERMGKLDLGFFSGSRQGAIQKTMDESVEKFEDYIAHIFPNMVGAGLFILILFVFLAAINVWLALITLVAIVVGVLVEFLGLAGKRGKNVMTQLNQAMQDMDSEFAEYINGMEEEKIFGRDEATARKLVSSIENYRSWMLNYMKRSLPIFGAYRAITLSVVSFVCLAGVIMLGFDQGNHALMLQILMFLIVVPALNSPLMELVELGSSLLEVSVRMTEVDEIMNIPLMAQPKSTTMPRNHTIELKEVSFSYQDTSDPHSSMALSGVSLIAHEGRLTALVGPSGGGKSTVAQLIARFWDIDQGAITIGGVDIKDIATPDLMELMAFVFQDTHIFSASVFDNIAMNKPVEHEKLISAAKAAQCHDFIEALPEGYHTKLGDGGHTLSGGEEQRIAIARAILKDSPIIVLDEAMAFSDAENEALLRTALAHLIKEKTAIIIAHRLTSVAQADQIIVLDEGRIVEQGTHTQLLMDEGLYAHLWNTQTKTSAWVMKGGA